MSEGKSENFIKRGWRNVREAGPRRLGLTVLLLVLALVVARYSWIIPVLGDAELATYDSRVFAEANENQVEQDDRVILLVYDDQTLFETRKRSPLDRALLAETLRNIDQMAPKAIGIDILFDQPQDEDEELIETLRSMQTPTFVAYADTNTNEGSITYEQQEFLDQFVTRLDGSNAGAASVRLAKDTDNVTRRWPEQREDLPPLLGRAMLAATQDADKTLPGYEGAVRYRYSGTEGEPVFSSVAIQTLRIPEVSEALSPLISDSYVLIGGDIVDIDRLPTPLSEVTNTTDPPGILFHATTIAQMLDGAALPRPLPITIWLLSILFIVMAALTGLLEWGSWKIYLLVGLQFAAIIGVPFAMQFAGIDTYGLPAVGWLAGWVVAFSAVTSAARAAGAVQRNFAQGALGKYLPREMANEIIENPDLLALHGEKNRFTCCSAISRASPR